MQDGIWMNKDSAADSLGQGSAALSKLWRAMAWHIREADGVL
jgi:hypothetical protein